MATRGSVRELRKAVAAMKKGERIYVNAINLTAAGVEALRRMIENDVLALDSSELAKYIVPAARGKYIVGKSICPQMTYIKL